MKRREFLKHGIGALSTLAVGEIIVLTPGEAATDASVAGESRKSARRKMRRPHDYRKAKVVRSVCLNCSTVCGIEGFVIDGKVVKVRGNPEDPNNGKSLCAKGQSGPTINYNPERLLYPLKRVGQRGEGKWRRITWDEAYDEIAARIRAAIDSGRPEEVALQVGRSRIGGEIRRFLNAIGTPTQINHRALCSSNKRAANYVSLGDTDWESVDASQTKYILNFGSNFYEAHQGAIHLAKRVVRGRFDNGAKLVTFDVRLSNTAGRSDEWWAPNPGSEGAIALAMGNTIMGANQFDREFLDNWCNINAEALKAWLEPYTPEWAEKISGVPAADIRRLALEFAAARPRCAAFTNRGSGAHYNGFNNDRAVVMLNAIVGSVGQEGGYCYTEEPTRVPGRTFPDVQPQPPRPTRKSILENPPEWPLANKWQRMRVGQVVYDYIKDGRAKLQVYLSYTVSTPTTWPEGRSVAVDVLKDETLIPFHACSDIIYSEQAHYADLILPDATYFERWGFDTRNNMELRDYVTLRQPVVPPPAECVSFVDSMIQIGRRLGPDLAKYFPFEDHEEWIKLRCQALGKVVGEDGFEYMKKHGVWQDTTKPKYYGLYSWAIPARDMEAARIDEATGIIYRKAADGVEQKIGLMVGGKACRGFQTPSRKFSIYHEDIVQAAKQVGLEDDGMPRYVPVPAFESMTDEQLHLVSFKWNVHTQARTASQKYLTEIVHHNPLWINAATAGRYGIRTGDLVEITTFRPRGHTYKATGEKIGSAVVAAYVTEGIHPRVIAMSNSLGQHYQGRVATARPGSRQNLPAWNDDVIPEDEDIAENIWWDPRKGGSGEGYNINAILPISPSPLVGMQSWYDTVCTIRRL